MFSTVLIIDKRPELSIKYKKSLTSSEINTIVANTLKDALIEIQKIEPDMIIISDSIEEELASFCERVRALTYTTRPIIIALSKSAETDDKIKVLESEIVNTNSQLSPGTIIDVTKDRIIIKTQDQALAITKLKPFGKRAMTTKEYLNGLDKNKIINKIVR